ncbi:carboxylesterase/lipase family protein [Pseudoblastomonas halimionae]|uniref:carboxylesterase/lipase family protein n=1 Tax=Alteriqipengyuania halimionae TaxID=1926630 RepID=UPI002D7FCD6E|nr:carboxylesterase family protein [Alteriqipengyuania halimionae]
MIAAPVGKVAGRIQDGIASYKGIPYAAAPTGERRWKPPVAASGWTGVRDAGEFGPSCFQPVARDSANSIYRDDVGELSEDCLSLNVWTPGDARNAPVFVWIHGGALVSGGTRRGMYDGARFAREGVIFVSINYRLGALGYLAYPELSAESPRGISGNYGLLDQIEALRWIQRNIASFGGDPDNVTVAGESAGALSVMYLMASPDARGLFAKAVSESGYMISSPALATREHGHVPAEAQGAWLQQQLKAPDLAAMRAMPADELVARSTAAGFLTWGTIDGAVLPRQIADIFDRGEQADVPLLAGFNAGEIRSLRRLLPPAPADAAAYEARIRTTHGELADRYLALYPASDIDESMLATTRDALYGWTAERMGRKQAAIGAPAYIYLFDHGYPATDETGLHAFHASEIPFALGTIDRTTADWPHIPRTPEQYALSDIMVDYWTSFARSGAPTSEGGPAWPTFGDTGRLMVFADGAQVRSGGIGDAYALYEEIVCRRRAAGELPWHWNVGIIAPPLPGGEGRCR